MKGTIDIESFPGHYRAFVDRMWKTSILKEDDPIRPASFSIKEYGKGKAYTRGVWEFKNEKEFVKDLHQEVSKYQILIGHNAKKFDLRQINSFFAMYDLPQTSVHIEDTLTIVRKHFRLPSYKLKYCLQFFKIGEKLRTGGEDLWFDAESGDEKARKHFLKYNENDTVMTEKLYKYLYDKGWARPLTSNYFSVRNGCPRCGEKNWNFRGERADKWGWHEYVWCKSCGKYGMIDTLLRPWR